MAQKTHPTGFRLIIQKNWGSVWFDDKNYAKLLQQDEKIRNLLYQMIGSAGIDEITISRSNNDVSIDLRVARPGLVIGRGGAMIEAVKKQLASIIEGRIRLNVVEVPNVDLSPALVAENITGALERRYPYKRAVSGALKKVMDSGAKGVRIVLAGRLDGNTIARTEKFYEGSVPTSTLTADVKYAYRFAKTKKGTVGVKVWITQPEKKEKR
ncbi:30S ribosomal protein S3 [candidate division WWE3 bacterium]|nr:30S ribosomal protein S3 [candidate division WWE3 bacterium]